MDFWTLLILVALFRLVGGYMQRRNRAEQQRQPSRPPRRTRRVPVPRPEMEGPGGATEPERLPPLPTPPQRRRVESPQAVPPGENSEPPWGVGESEETPWSYEDDDIRREMLERLRRAAEMAAAVQAQPTVTPVQTQIDVPSAPRTTGPSAAPDVSFSSQWLHRELRDPQSLRAAVILREVLGPPRAHQRRRSAR